MIDKFCKGVLTENPKESEDFIHNSDKVGTCCRSRILIWN